MMHLKDIQQEEAIDALIEIAAGRSTTGTPLSGEKARNTARTALARLGIRWSPPNVDTDLRPIRKIQMEVCRKYNIKMRDMLGRRQVRPLVTARHEAIVRVSTETGAIYAKVARMFDRDPSTILYVVGKAGAT